jgi:predicted dehydrogenase
MVVGTNRLRVGLLGYGLAGRVFHAPLVAATDGLELAVIVTADPGRRSRARADYPGVRVVETADQLFAAASGLDLVVVATPNRAHVPLARRAIDAGLAVVIDKPLAPTSADGRELIATARARGVPLTVFQNRRWDGDFLTVSRLVREGALGRVLRFESRFERWQPTIVPGFRESGQTDDAGGVLFDLGAHLVDQAMRLFGPPTTVYAELDRRRSGAAIDDDAFVALGHASGSRSHLWMSAVASQLGPRMRVIGDRAAYVKFGLDVEEDQLAAGLRPGDPGYGEDPIERWGRLGTDAESESIPTEPGRYGAFYSGVAAALRDGSPMPVDPAESVAVLEVIEAAIRSASEARTITLGS